MSKIIESNSWQHPHEVNAHDAIKGSISITGSEHVEVMAVLIQLLVDAKALTLEQIEPMLSSNYKVEE